MDIRGLIKFSLVDYPGKVSCIIFSGGCNFKCAYCHNPHLVFDPESQPIISEKDLFKFLDSRSKKLDGVVISGGEPTLQKDLLSFAEKIKAKGFLIKLDTNASRPDVVIKGYRNGLIDSLGIDYKAPREIYNKIARKHKKDLHDRVKKTITFAVDNNIPVEVRTTVHKSLLSNEHLKVMKNELKEMGIKDWVLQQFNPVEIIDDELLDIPTYSDLELMKIARTFGKKVHVRGLKGIFLE